MATKRKVKKVAKRRRTTKDTPLTKLDFWAIAANEVYLLLQGLKQRFHLHNIERSDDEAHRQR